MIKFIVLLCCVIGFIHCACTRGSGCPRKKCPSSGCSNKCPTSGCSSGSTSSGTSSNAAAITAALLAGYGDGGVYTGQVDYDYDLIPLPAEVGQVGILDSPYYDCEAQSLYFADLFKKNVYRYSEQNNQVYWATLDNLDTPSTIIPVRGKPGTFIVGTGTSLYLVQWDGISQTAKVVGIIATVESGTNHHTNHAIAGPKGAIYFGTFAPTLCSGDAVSGFFRWTQKNGVEPMPGKYKTTNSLGYDYKNNTLYHSDGCTQTITAFKINPRTGKVSQPRVVISGMGFPNTVAACGLSVDRRGFLRVGSYRGGVLLTINPTNGQIVEQHAMPTRFIAANAFGGCNYDKLYVMTSQIDADILTGTVTNYTVGYPGGTIIALRNMGQGVPVKKPCVGC